MELFPRVVEQLKARGVDDVLLFAGGIIPDEDIPTLQEMSFRAIFRPGASTSEIVDFLRQSISAFRSGESPSARGKRS
jgi:methylmalonyl-CoA mutase C-terminal domain/subunit